MSRNSKLKAQSTNPFDSSDDDESSSGEMFHDCQDDLGQSTTTENRAAPLDFNFASAQTHDPALNFANSAGEPSEEFISPLESAMLSWADSIDNNAKHSPSATEQDHSGNTEQLSDDSPWSNVVRKAADRLTGNYGYWTRNDIEPPAEEEGRVSRRGSYTSARSVDSDRENSPLDPRLLSTPIASSRRQSVERGSVTVRRRNTRGSYTEQLRSSMKTIQASRVLEKLEDFDRDGYQDSTGTLWSKVILLEELGTASSWTILLLPYIAFLLCVLLDTRSFFMVTSVGPLHASFSCLNSTSTPMNVPPIPVPSDSCSYPYELEPGKGLLANGKKSYLFQTYRYGELMSNGTAFVSRPIQGVSPLSTFLYGDAIFSHIPIEAVALVARGRVLVSAVILQRNPETSSDWIPAFIAKPEPLSLHCMREHLSRHPSVNSRWTCTSPRTIDVLFQMPGTGIMSNEDVQVNVLYSLLPRSYNPLKMSSTNDEDSVVESRPSFVYSETDDITKFISNVTALDPDDVLADLVQSSSYVVDHESSLYANVQWGVRLFTLTLTFVFTCVWCWCMGMKGFFATGGQECCCNSIFCCLRARETEDMLPLSGKWKSSMTWWQSPWIVFPERRYLLLLLLGLLLIQNPLLTFAFFQPTLYSSKGVHRAADSMVGLGVHACLFVWLCLMEGLRYHTAASARRRAKHQRQILELQRAAKYTVRADMARAEHIMGSPTPEEITRYTTEYFDRHGDVDGSASAGALQIRLSNDPCGDDWADFLLPKLLLLVIGAVSVLLAATCRFPTASDSSVSLSPKALYRYNTIYAASSMLQFIVLVLWLYCIIKATFVTGRKLRKEPFLSTRPAQLAYRILLGITILMIGALAVPFLFDLWRLLAKWTGGHDGQVHPTYRGVEQSRQVIVLDILLKLVIKAGEKFPYSGTAASIGPGKLVFATTCALIAAFIFLPSRSADKDEKDHGRAIVGGDIFFSALPLTEKMKQRRDKRIVVPLARYTRTWRVFPLPIKKLNVASQLLSESSFQLDDGERSVVYFGRYMPVFCLELACWLLEASWQAYYSPKDFSLDDWAPGRMALDRIGLQLEHALDDESTHTQAYIASNLSSQVDGEEDSIIVIAFRGTASAKNIRTDLRSRQVPLPEQMMGAQERAIFHVYADRIDTFNTSGWFWDTPMRPSKVKTFSPKKKSTSAECLSTRSQHEKLSMMGGVSRGAKAALRATPVTQQALPCVHLGFLRAYLHLRQKLIEGVLEVLQRQLNNAVTRVRLSEATAENVSLVLPKIYITGHSLGGSLAQFLALDLASNCEIVVEVEPAPEAIRADEVFHLPSTPTGGSSTPAAEPSGRRARFFSFDDSEGEALPQRRTLKLQPPIAVYTYGQPRVGNHAFARLYKQRVPHTFRVSNEGDAFTTLPSPVLCGGTYKHAGLEVMLDEGCTGNTLVGPTVVETLFRFGKMRTSVAAHSMERYRDCLESGLKTDELEEYYRGHGTLKTVHDDLHSYGVSTSTETPMISDDLPAWLTQGKRHTNGS